MKRLLQNATQGEREFKNEILLLAKLRHRNLVRLLGYSLRATERLLIYEFIANGSVDNFIYGNPINIPYEGLQSNFFDSYFFKKNS